MGDEILCTKSFCKKTYSGKIHDRYMSLKKQTVIR